MRSALASTLLSPLLLLGAGCGASPDALPPRYDHVVLVTIDTLRADHLGCYGYPLGTSPFLDRLAEESVLFTRAHATVSHTAPSHASMFTGLLPPQHGVQQNGDELTSEVPNVAQVFGNAGYRTGAFTSTGFLERAATGFEFVDGRLREGERTIDVSLAWAERLDPDERFLLWVHLFDVHEAELTGAATPAIDYARVRRGTTLAPDELYPYLAQLHGLPDPPPGEPFPGLPWEGPQGAGNGRPAFLATRAEVVASIDHYDAKIAYVDRQIRRLYVALRALRPDRSALWAITADHGEGLGSHGYRGHGGLIYQEQLRVPLLFHATDDSLTPGRVEALVSLVDLYPTLAESLGTLPPRPAIEGISLWPHLRGRAPVDEPRVVFAQRRPLPNVENDLFAVITRTKKYILHTAAPDQFFDLAADPGERHSAIDDPEAERYLARIQAKLAELRLTERVSTATEELPPDVLEELGALGYVR